jgi:hypothetical protein
MNQPYGNTPVKIAAFMEFQRGKKKLATTTGGEPVHSACGGESGRMHGNDVSIPLNRMQGNPPLRYAPNDIGLGAGLVAHSSQKRA